MCYNLNLGTSISPSTWAISSAPLNDWFVWPCPLVLSSAQVILGRTPLANIPCLGNWLPLSPKISDDPALPSVTISLHWMFSPSDFPSTISFTLAGYKYQSVYCTQDWVQLHNEASFVSFANISNTIFLAF